MGEWLGDTPIFQQSMTERERTEFALFKTKVKAIDTKETDMAKKNDVQTTIDNITTESKEDTMTENVNATAANTEKKETTVRYNYREDKARHAEIRDAAKLGRVKAVEGITSCLPGKTAANFTDDPAEVTLLGKAAAKFGWGNEFCTVSQAKKFGGELDPEYEGHGWLVKYLPKTAKTGKNAGKTTQFETVVYPKAAFVWHTESGEPEFDEQAEAERKAKAAKRAANRAARALKEANAAAGIKPKRKVTRKAPKVEAINDVPNAAAAPSADVAALMETVNALAAQNAQLIAALTATLNK